MEFRNVETFLSVVDNGNFSEAADVLGYTQSTVTVHIKQLEEELGVLLFERIGKRVVITDEGTRFYEYGQRILREMESAKRALSADDQPKGTLKVGTFHSMATTIMPGIITEMHKRFPLVNVEIEIADLDTLFDLLRHNKLDLMYTLSGQALGEEFMCEHEQEESIHFVCSSMHPLATKKDITLQKIAKEEFLLPERDMKMSEYRKEFERLMSAAGFAISPVIETPSTDLIIELVKTLNAVSFLPDYATERGVSEGSLIRMDVACEDVSLPLRLIYHRDKWISRPMEAFMSLI